MSTYSLRLVRPLTSVTQLQNRVPERQGRCAFFGRLKEIIYVEMPFIRAAGYDLGNIIFWEWPNLGHC